MPKQNIKNHSSDSLDANEKDNFRPPSNTEKRTVLSFGAIFHPSEAAKKERRAARKKRKHTITKKYNARKKSACQPTTKVENTLNLFVTDLREENPNLPSPSLENIRALASKIVDGRLALSVAKRQIQDTIPIANEFSRI